MKFKKMKVTLILCFPVLLIVCMLSQFMPVHAEITSGQSTGIYSGDLYVSTLQNIIDNRQFVMDTFADYDITGAKLDTSWGNNPNAVVNNVASEPYLYDYFLDQYDTYEPLKILVDSWDNASNGYIFKTLPSGLDGLISFADFQSFVGTPEQKNFEKVLLSAITTNYESSIGNKSSQDTQLTAMDSQEQILKIVDNLDTLMKYGKLYTKDGNAIECTSEFLDFINQCYDTKFTETYGDIYNGQQPYDLDGLFNDSQLSLNVIGSVIDSWNLFNSGTNEDLAKTVLGDNFAKDYSTYWANIVGGTFDVSSDDVNAYFDELKTLTGDAKTTLNEYKMYQLLAANNGNFYKTLQRTTEFSDSQAYKNAIQAYIDKIYTSSGEYTVDYKKALIDSAAHVAVDTCGKVVQTTTENYISQFYNWNNVYGNIPDPDIDKMTALQNVATFLQIVQIVKIAADATWQLTKVAESIVELSYLRDCQKYASKTFYSDLSLYKAFKAMGKNVEMSDAAHHALSDLAYLKQLKLSSTTIGYNCTNYIVQKSLFGRTVYGWTSDLSGVKKTYDRHMDALIDTLIYPYANSPLNLKSGDILTVTDNNAGITGKIIDSNGNAKGSFAEAANYISSGIVGGNATLMLNSDHIVSFPNLLATDGTLTLKGIGNEKQTVVVRNIEGTTSQYPVIFTNCDATITKNLTNSCVTSDNSQLTCSQNAVNGELNASNAGKIEVKNDCNASININEGTVIIDKNYSMDTPDKVLKMNKSTSYLHVCGDYYTQGNTENHYTSLGYQDYDTYLSAGTIEFNGNVTTEKVFVGDWYHDRFPFAAAKMNVIFRSNHAQTVNCITGSRASFGSITQECPELICINGIDAESLVSDATFTLNDKYINIKNGISTFVTVTDSIGSGEVQINDTGHLLVKGDCHDITASMNGVNAKFEVNGNYINSTLKLGGATAVVHGDYRMQQKDSNGVYGHAGCYISSSIDTSHLIVYGNFYADGSINTTQQSNFNRGTIELKGDLYIYPHVETAGFYSTIYIYPYKFTNETKTIFSSDKEQHIHAIGAENWNVGTMIQSCPKLICDNGLYATDLATDSILMLNNSLINVDNGINTSVTVLDNIGKGTVKINNSGSVLVKGNCTTMSAVMTGPDAKFEVNGNVLNSSLALGGATAVIHGDYRMQQLNLDGTYSHSGNYISSGIASSHLIVYGDFYADGEINTTQNSNFDRGTIELKKNLYIYPHTEASGFYSTIYRYPFKFTNETNIIFSSTDEQYIHGLNDTDWSLGTLTQQCPKLICDKNLYAKDINSDATLMMNGSSLIVDNGINTAITVLDNLSGGTLKINNTGSVLVEGSCYGISTEMTGTSAKLEVNGDYVNSSLNMGGATILVHGDYRMQQIAGDGTYEKTSARISGGNNSSHLIVDGDFYADGELSNNNQIYLSSGTLEFKGDLYIYPRHEYGYMPDAYPLNLMQEVKTVFSSDKPQTIHAAGADSWILGTISQTCPRLICDNGFYASKLASDINIESYCSNVTVYNWDNHTLSIFNTTTDPSLNAKPSGYEIKKKNFNTEKNTYTYICRPIVNRYNVTFTDGDTTYTIADDLVTHSYIDQPQNPKKDGYVFMGWYKEPEYQNEWLFNHDYVTANTTLYAKWENLDKLNVYSTEYYLENLDGSGYSLAKSETISTDKENIQASVTDFNGFTFDTQNSANVLTSDSISKAVMKVYYTRNSYDITLNLNNVGSLSQNVISGKYGSIISLPSPSENGYQFLGWYHEPELESIANQSTSITGNETLYAKWYQNAADLSGKFETDHYLETSNGDLLFQVDLNTVANILHGDYINNQIGIPDSSNTKTVNDIDSTSSQIRTLKLYYKPMTASYTVSFENGNHGTKPASITGLTNGSTIAELPVISQTGYEFNGWYKDSACTEPFIQNVDQVTSSITLYAKWSNMSWRHYYTTEHYVEDLDGNYTLKESYTQETKLNAVDAVPLDYIGYEADLSNPNSITHVDLGTETGMMKLYYSRKLYSIIFDTDEKGTQIPNDKVKFGKSVNKPEPPVSSDYQFVNWYSDSACTQLYDFTQLISQDTTLYAKWTMNIYSLDLTAPQFNAIYYGSNQTAGIPLEITNTGNATASISDVKVSSQEFLVTRGDTAAKIGMNNSWSIRPADNLHVGTHKAVVTVYYNNGKTASADVSIEINIGEQQAPAKPIAQYVKPNSIAIQPIDTNKYQAAIKYRIVGEEWQDSPIFENLHANTEYTIEAKYDATADCHESGTNSISIKTPQYQIVEGEEQKINVDLSKNEKFEFRSDAQLDKFVEVRVDNNKVSSNYFTVTSGSTIITFTPEFIETLSSGIHELSIVSTDGTAETTFTIIAPSATPTVVKQEMYRLYNPNSGEHFYTANAGERDMLQGVGWSYEGLGWTAPATSNTPVYRLYNANAGDHHYTMNAGEKDMLVSVGWSYEGVGWYSDDAQGVPLYRQYNPNAVAGSHNYTVNAAERDMLVSIGWHDEGIGWYGVKN